MTTFSIITLFPEIFPPVLNSSIIGRGQKKGKIEFEYINLREFGEGVHQVVDDKPYGGGVGLVFKADILAKALKSVKRKRGIGKVILTSASGKKFNQQTAKDLSKQDHIIIICGHYEGVDERFVEKYVDLELSIGDYVLTGGEIPTMVIADAVARIIPGVLEKAEAAQKESFEEGLLEHPHYTRPEEFEGIKVPEILRSGHHGEVDKWRKLKSFEKTKKNRPDMIQEDSE
jgi:tRNA (guanine37-N1)-methyltransferase